jgi:hypothetical protein
MYKKGEYDLAGFSVGAVKRSEILPQGIVAGDMLIGTYVLYVHTCQSLLGCNYCDRRLPCPVLSSRRSSFGTPFYDELSSLDAAMLPT